MVVVAGCSGTAGEYTADNKTARIIATEPVPAVSDGCWLCGELMASTMEFSLPLGIRLVHEEHRTLLWSVLKYLEHIGIEAGREWPSEEGPPIVTGRYDFLTVKGRTGMQPVVIVDLYSYGYDREPATYLTAELLREGAKPHLIVRRSERQQIASGLQAIVSQEVPLWPITDKGPISFKARFSE